jgi:5-methyltetrahydropteroyltriglutamate--homocysteine methyltransferase
LRNLKRSGHRGSYRIRNCWQASRTLRLSLDEQIRAGIDIVSDGEQTRQHFVTTFIEHLSGVDFENRQTVRIRNRYDASVPTVVSAVASETGIRRRCKVPAPAHGQADQMGPAGPMTMIDTLYDAHYKSREKLAWEFAKILNQEARVRGRRRGYYPVR